MLSSDVYHLLLLDIHPKLLNLKFVQGLYKHPEYAIYTLR